MARPKRKFTDKEIKLIKEYAKANCKSETIAKALNIPVNTLKRRFGRIMQENRAKGKLRLKHRQHKMSHNNAQMAIWLGKQDLGQVDKREIKTDNVEAETARSPKEQAAIAAAARAYNETMSRSETSIKLRRINNVS